MTTDTGRIEAFSDGVFAIAITLLILEIKVPGTSDHSLGRMLVRQWPSYIAFLFKHIARTDDALLALNLLLMLGITTVPFPTAVLATHLAGPDAHTAAVLYNAIYVVIAVFFNVLWRYAVSMGLVEESLRSDSAPAISKQYAYGPLLTWCVWRCLG